jgi:Spy/CpxP family protein refolding chaperone
MKENRFYKILIVLLIILNLTTLFFFWNMKKHGPPDKNELVELLDLTGKSKLKILALQEVHFREKENLLRRSRQLHEQLFQSFSDSSKDKEDIAFQINLIVENQRETEQMTFDYFKEVNSLCTPEQRLKLQKLIQRVFNRAGGPPPPNKD